MENMVPEIMPEYVKYGYYDDIERIIQSEIFFPTYITGLSGNGKTLMVDQACANVGREMVRTNITIETDEDDLLGGFRLIDGETIFVDGPVVVAMKRGAMLLLDEVDLGQNRLLCLQPVLEGKGIFLKKKKEYVKPKDGFNVMATANTKGRGNDDGKFVGTNILNEAFLERFAITFEQDYPALDIEVDIINRFFAKYDIDAGDFPQLLATWAETIRRAYRSNALDEIVSTRRIIHICTSFILFNKSREKAIRHCLARFDPEVSNAFADYYGKIDKSVDQSLLLSTT